MANPFKTPSISFVNLKGGVGKTAVTVNLAFALAEWHQKKVLVVDIDPQFNATQHLLDEETIVENLSNSKTVKDILDPTPPAIQVAKKTKQIKIDPADFLWEIGVHGKGSIDLIPSLLDLSFVSRNPAQKEGRLEVFLRQIEGDYDVILIDCPPTISVLTMAAFNASRYFVVPVTPDYFAPIGIPLIEEEVAYYLDNMHAATGTMRPLGIIFTIVDARWHADWGSIAGRVKSQTEIDIFKTHFTNSKYWRDCASTHEPVYRDKPNSHAASQLRKFADEFVLRLDDAELSDLL